MKGVTAPQGSCHCCEGIIRRGIVSLGLLFLVSLLLLLAEGRMSPLLLRLHGLGASVVVAREELTVEEALGACHGLRGRGVAHYAALPGARHVPGPGGGQQRVHAEDAGCASEIRGRDGSGNGSLATHCCETHISFNGRSGNILTQYAAARYFAEINSCAMPCIQMVSGHEPEGVLGWQGDKERCHLQWPPAPGWSPASQHTLTNPIEAYNLHRDAYAGALNFRLYPEQANWQYAALSLGWDLAGGSLLGSGLRGLNKLITSSAAVKERSARWARHREACAAAGTRLMQQQHQQQQQRGNTDPALVTSMEALHPWLPTGVRSVAEGILSGTHPAAQSPGLQGLRRNPERTIVLHIRLDDVYRGNMDDALERTWHGIDRTVDQWGAHRERDWLGMTPPVAHVDVSHFPAGQVLEMQEGTAARLTPNTAPFSYYATLLRATREAWDEVLVVGDSTLASTALFQALQREFNASMQTSSADVDFATLVLARQLVLSGASTFSFSAAMMGRARVIHAPHAGTLGVHSAAQMTCFLTPGALDPRWVYHDIYRAAVRRLAGGFDAQAAAARAEGLHAASEVTREWALKASAGQWRDGHVEWRRFPLGHARVEWQAIHSEGCPEDDEELGTRGLARALGRLGAGALGYEEEGEGGGEGEGERGRGRRAPLYFLTHEELVDYYRIPACFKYFYPAKAHVYSFEDKKPVPTCSDNVYMAPLKEAGFDGRNCRVNEQWAQPCEN